MDVLCMLIDLCPFLVYNVYNIISNIYTQFLGILAVLAFGISDEGCQNAQKLHVNLLATVNAPQSGQNYLATQNCSNKPK